MKLNIFLAFCVTFSCVAFAQAVVTPPSITTQPVDTTVTVGQTAKFTVTATGTKPLSYQWTKNGVNITGATNPSYTTPPTTLADNGSLFAATVTNSVGSVTSNNATLTVNPAPARSAAIIKTYGRLVIPSTGIYWGAQDTNDSFTGPDGIETVLGRTMAIRRGGYNWNNGPAAMPTLFEIDNAAHINPYIISLVAQHDGINFPVKFSSPHNGFIGWDSTNTAPNINGDTGIDRITDGEFDVAFIAQFIGLKGLSGPVIYNLFFEFNGAHSNYFAEAQGVHGTALYSPGSGEIAYANAYRHIRQLADAAGASIDHGGNVIFVWTAQHFNSVGWFQNYYPGDDYVDFIAIDLYRRTCASGMNNPTPTGGTGDNLIYQFAEGTQAGSSAVGRGTSVKPVMVCEAGYDNGIDYPDSGTGGDGRNYRKDSDLPSAPLNIEAKLLDDFQLYYPDVIAYVTYNVIDGNHFNQVDQSAESLSRYQVFANDPYCELFYTP